MTMPFQIDRPPTYTFKLSGKYIDVPSGHVYRKHPMALSNWAKKFKPAFHNMELVPRPNNGYYKKVRIMRYVKTLRGQYDYDNYVFGCKPLVDWLVKKGIIEGDRPNQVRVIYGQETSERSKLPTYVEIELYG